MAYLGLFALLVIGIIFVSGCTTQKSSITGSAIAQPTQETPKCEPNWQCTEWSFCVRTGQTSGTQNRTCNDLNSCNTASSKPSESQTCILPAITTKEPSQLALQLSDFPSGQNYTLKERTERVRSDVSSSGLELGWQKGYAVKYYRIGSIFDMTAVEQAISIYPVENISKVLTIPYNSTENTTINELSKPNIGDDSRAYRFDTGTDRIFRIEFIKMDVYISLDMYGITTDYELLKDLAKTVESRIS